MGCPLTLSTIACDPLMLKLSHNYTLYPSVTMTTFPFFSGPSWWPSNYPLECPPLRADMRKGRGWLEFLHSLFRLFRQPGGTRIFHHLKSCNCFFLEGGVLQNPSEDLKKTVYPVLREKKCSHRHFCMKFGDSLTP